jgi:hypothetical protein
MSERSTGVLLGGVIALIGAIFGLWATFAILATGDILAPLLGGGVAAAYAYLILIGSILTVIFAIMMLMGKMVKISTILVFIAGIISILVVIAGGAVYALAGLLELVGAIIAMATGALSA